MQIVNVPIEKLTPYAKNPRKNDKAVDAVAESIRQFGMKVPCVIDRNGVLVTGHTRVKACKKLGIKEVPCIVADDLSDDQIRAFRLADNKVAEIADWDFDLLADEIADIDIDMDDFGFDTDSLFDDGEMKELYRNEYRGRTVHILNLDKMNCGTSGTYDIPQLKPLYEVPPVTEWIGFNYVMSDNKPEGKGVHFFVDDYQFERVWTNPDAYIDKLSKYAVVATPDFSPYEDMPLATQIFNHYRKHWVGRYWQEFGITVIPTIRASADPRSLDWYLEGEPKGSAVLISSMWCRNEDVKRYFVEEEYRRMCESLKPSKVFVYGEKIEELGNVEYIETFTRKKFDAKG